MTKQLHDHGCSYNEQGRLSLLVMTFYETVVVGNILKTRHLPSVCVCTCTCTLCSERNRILLSTLPLPVTQFELSAIEFLQQTLRRINCRLTCIEEIKTCRAPKLSLNNTEYYQLNPNIFWLTGGTQSTTRRGFISYKTRN